MNLWEGISSGSPITRDVLILSIVWYSRSFKVLYSSADCRSWGGSLLRYIYCSKWCRCCRVVHHIHPTLLVSVYSTRIIKIRLRFNIQRFGCD